MKAFITRKQPTRRSEFRIDGPPRQCAWVEPSSDCSNFDEQVDPITYDPFDDRVFRIDKMCYNQNSLRKWLAESSRKKLEPRLPHNNRHFTQSMLYSCQSQQSYGNLHEMAAKLGDRLVGMLEAPKREASRTRRIARQRCSDFLDQMDGDLQKHATVLKQDGIADYNDAIAHLVRIFQDDRFATWNIDENKRDAICEIQLLAMARKLQQSADEDLEVSMDKVRAVVRDQVQTIQHQLLELDAVASPWPGEVDLLKGIRDGRYRSVGDVQNDRDLDASATRLTEWLGTTNLAGKQFDPDVAERIWPYYVLDRIGSKDGKGSVYSISSYAESANLFPLYAFYSPQMTHDLEHLRLRYMMLTTMTIPVMKDFEFSLVKAFDVHYQVLTSSDAMQALHKDELIWNVGIVSSCYIDVQKHAPLLRILSWDFDQVNAEMTAMMTEVADAFPEFARRFSMAQIGKLRQYHSHDIDTHGDASAGQDVDGHSNIVPHKLISVYTPQLPADIDNLEAVNDEGSIHVATALQTGDGEGDVGTTFVFHPTGIYEDDHQRYDVYLSNPDASSTIVHIGNVSLQVTNAAAHAAKYVGRNGIALLRVAVANGGRVAYHLAKLGFNKAMKLTMKSAPVVVNAGIAVLSLLAAMASSALGSALSYASGMRRTGRVRPHPILKRMGRGNWTSSQSFGLHRRQPLRRIV